MKKEYRDCAREVVMRLGEKDAEIEQLRTDQRMLIRQCARLKGEVRKLEFLLEKYRRPTGSRAGLTGRGGGKEE
jgi:hypothetical protein